MMRGPIKVNLETILIGLNIPSRSTVGLQAPPRQVDMSCAISLGESMTGPVLFVLSHQRAISLN